MKGLKKTKQKKKYPRNKSHVWKNLRENLIGSGEAERASAGGSVGGHRWQPRVAPRRGEMLTREPLMSWAPPLFNKSFFFFFQQMHSRVTSHTTKLMTTAYVKSLGRTNPLASRSKNLTFSFMFACQVKLQKPVYINIMNYLINTMSYVNKWWNKLPKIYLSWNSSKKILNK